MDAPTRASTDGDDGLATGDPVLREIRRRLRSLDENCLGGLERALAAMADGDYTQSVPVVTEPVAGMSQDADVRALADEFNAILLRAQAAANAYEQLRSELVAALGDRSCLPELRARLHSLNDNCLSDLDAGLQAMADGDLTRAARPVTRPLVAMRGDDLGELGELFNEMLARSRTALRSYDSVREDLRIALGDHSCLDELRGRLQSLHRHCLRDLEESLEALVNGTSLTRPVAPTTPPLVAPPDAFPGELASLFNRMLARAQAAVRSLEDLRPDGVAVPPVPPGER